MDAKKKHIEEHPTPPTDNLQVPEKNERGLGLSVLLIFSLVYNGLLLLIFIVSLFYPVAMQELLQIYFKQFYISKLISFLIVFSATAILGTSFYGLILLWKMKRIGFYYFASAQILVLLSIILVLRSYDWINIGVILSVLLILGFSIRKMN